MPFSGGTYSRVYTWATEALTPPIAISKLDDQEIDMAAALSNCILRDGTGLPTAAIDWNAQRITNLAAATAANDAVRAAQIQGGALLTLGSVAGTNTITGNLTPALAAYVAHMHVTFTPANNNTGAATLAVNGLTALDIQKDDGDALVSGDLIAGIPAVLVLDTGADDWILLNPQSANLSNGVAMSDLARLSQANTVTGSPTTFSGTAPELRWNETDGAADNKLWYMTAAAETFGAGTRTDAGVFGAEWLTVNRTGTTVDSVGLSATSILLTGNATLTGAEFETGVISPAALANGNNNDYAPAGFASARILRLTPDAGGSTLTGLAGGVAGRIVTVFNIHASVALQLAAESASSSAANRFGIGTLASISAGYGLALWYDGTSSRWRPAF